MVEVTLVLSNLQIWNTIQTYWTVVQVQRDGHFSQQALACTRYIFLQKGQLCTLQKDTL